MSISGSLEEVLEVRTGNAGEVTGFLLVESFIDTKYNTFSDLNEILASILQFCIMCITFIFNFILSREIQTSK